jgi:hypothetical protein
MGTFVKCYRGLRERYPGIVFDEDFDRWMQVTDLDQYIAAFDFGSVHPPEAEWGDPPTTVKKGDFFVFDASRLQEGNFCWAKGGWARKKDAERYVLGVLSGTPTEMGHLDVDGSAWPPSMIPLKAVGRVLRGHGEGHHVSAHLVVTFDYGSETMRGEMAFEEGDMPAVEQFSDEKRYAELLSQVGGSRDLA